MSDERLFQNYKYDIFISYTHDDDDRMPGEESGWVSWLHEYLEKRLKTVLNKPPVIWRDKQRMNPGDKINETLASGVTNSAILLSVISPRYLRSRYCKEELWNFYRHVEQKRGPRLENELGIIKVVKYPVDYDDYPNDVPVEVRENLLGFECYGLNKETKSSFAFHTKRDEIEFSTKCEYLVQVLKQMVERLCTQNAAPPAKPSMTFPAGVPNSSPVAVTDTALYEKTVYLAETSSDFDNQRCQIKSELIDHGFFVLPEAPFSRTANAPTIAAQIRDLLRRSRVSVHTIGDVDAFSPEKSKSSIEEMQYQLAAERCGQDDFARIVWLPPNLKLEPDSRQAKFIETLRKDEGMRQRDDLLDGKILEDVRSLIRDRMKPKQPPPPLPHEDNGDEITPYIYLICDKVDDGQTDHLKDCIAEYGGAPLIADRSDDATFNETHRQSLEYCDGVMIYLGGASEPWARLIAAAADKFKRKLQQPVAPKAFYLDKPQTPQKTKFIQQGTTVIRCYEQPQPEAIRAFINLLKRNK